MILPTVETYNASYINAANNNMSVFCVLYVQLSTQCSKSGDIGRGRGSYRQ